ncbi:type II secretion system protein [Sulfurimonas lithotrophica]|uniref:Type II secretion system protein n=1 Tax=Sulfurimonas lithotrophica TaxID=2590022 RepID=A0A5P8NYX3_9BACT|nr:type II secretion system protein [Sulfurimonas lithotrophica]QFR48639.1 type II secretion system protein [Sulfurimonas lithotrophica]
MRKAFTLLELVFVIVVIGILAAAIIPRVNTDRLHEAAIQVVSHIRYTQHLAMNDDKYDDTNQSWYKGRWQFQYNTNVGTIQWPYTIYSDISHTGNANANGEIAVNPLNKSKLLTGGAAGFIIAGNSRRTEKMALGDTYGISNMNLSGGCAGVAQRISFDHMGRPMRGNPSSLVSAYETTRLIPSNNPCILTLTSSEGNVSIRIEGETGYTCILDSAGNCLVN